MTESVFLICVRRLTVSSSWDVRVWNHGSSSLTINLEQTKQISTQLTWTRLWWTLMDISWRILLGFEHENWVDHGFPLRPGFLFLLQDILLLFGCSLPSGSLGGGSRLASLQSFGNVRLLQEGAVGRVFPQQRVTGNTVEVSVECILFVLLWSSKLGNIKTSAIPHKPLFVRFSTRKQNATSLQDPDLREI